MFVFFNSKVMRKFLFFACFGALVSCGVTKEVKHEKGLDLTIEEKVGQTCQITLDAVAQTDAQGRTLVPLKLDTNKLTEALVKYKVGSILNVSWHTLTRAQWQEITQTIQSYYTSGRIKVPVLYGIDAIHGVNYTQGATLFPQEIGLQY